MIESSGSVSTRLSDTIGTESEFDVDAATRAGEAVEAAKLAWGRENAATTQDSGAGESADMTRLPIGAANNAGPTKIVSFPPPIPRTRPRPTFHALQEWEGYVVEIEDDEFVARLIDLTAGRSHETEEATIPLSEISEYDASRMVLGSIFRWVIGYERSPEGTRKRISQIVFRDLPRVTEADVREGEDWAREIAAAFGFAHD